MGGVKYMPLPKTQKFKGKRGCGGGLLMVEVPKGCFIPGARRWKEIVDLDEHRRIMQLFMFTLGVCVDTKATVCLETVVSDEFESTHNKKLSNMVNVLGYRLWIPLKWV